MKSIYYTAPDGTEAGCHPVPNARLVWALHGAEKVKVPLFVFERHLDRVALVAPEAWAETEDEFIARVMAKDVPAGATNVRVVES